MKALFYVKRKLISIYSDDCSQSIISRMTDGEIRCIQLNSTWFRLWCLKALLQIYRKHEYVEAASFKFPKCSKYPWPANSTMWRTFCSSLVRQPSIRRSRNKSLIQREQRMANSVYFSYTYTPNSMSDTYSYHTLDATSFLQTSCSGKMLMRVPDKRCLITCTHNMKT